MAPPTGALGAGCDPPRGAPYLVLKPDAVVDFEDLFPLLLVLYFVLRALGRRKTAPTPAPPSSETPARAPSSLEQIVRDIRTAVEEAQREAERKQAEQMPAPPSPTPLPLARPPLRPADAEFRSVETRADDFRTVEAPAQPEFHFSGGLGEPRQPAEFHDAHALTRGAPASAHMPGLDMPGAHLHDARSAPSAALHPLAARLRQPQAAREAFLLTELLGPPRSRRR